MLGRIEHHRGGIAAVIAATSVAVNVTCRGHGGESRKLQQLSTSVHQREPEVQGSGNRMAICEAVAAVQSERAREPASDERVGRGAQCLLAYQQGVGLYMW